MCPICIMGDGDYRGMGISFIVPLPNGYEEVIAARLPEVVKEADKICVEINGLVQQRASPFKNILIEYLDRTVKEQAELLRMFTLEISIDNSRGVYACQAGGDCNSGDIYLDSESMNWHDRTIYGFRQYFQNERAFHCHNIDYYWQALMTREFAVRYFNMLNAMITAMDRQKA